MSAASLHYSIFINQSPTKVYDVMIADNTYRQWTAAFNPTSHFKGDWSAGSKMYFIGNDEAGNEAGMVSKIKENQPGKFVSIEHLGEWKNGLEITEGPQVEQWTGALENYTYEVQEQGTFLKIDMIGGMGEYAEYFDATWPKALEILKSLCES
jgi:uncharacterized protein YndB with AHSA1/START domain